MSRLASLLTVSLVPLLLLSCSPDTETVYVTGPAPSIASVNPAEVASAETVLLTITGANFATGAAVFLDDRPADSVTVVSPGLITARFAIPATTGPGTLDLEVVNPDGQIARAPGAVTIPDAPAVAGVSPYGGPVGGGTAVTVTGTGFKAGAVVLVGGVAATNVTCNGATSISCTTPASPLGTPNQDGLARVTVKNPDGREGALYDDSAITAGARGFLYAVPPSVTGVTPDNGAQAGGTTVTITGTGFHRTIASGGEADADAGVTFDGTAATNVTVESDAQITCEAPAHGVGDVFVAVTNPDMQSGAGATPFHYNAFPVITGYTAPSGANGLVGTAGGTEITIAGDFFMESAANPPAVTVGGDAATNVTWVDATEVTCWVPVKSPPSTPYFYDLVLTNPDGQSVAWGPSTSDLGVGYERGPEVTGITPDVSPRAGGGAATITGTAFTGTCTVWFGSVQVPAAHVTVVPPSQIDLSAIPDSGDVIGHVDVRVQNSALLTGSLPGGFLYESSPAITGVSPRQGSRSGGVTVDVTGWDFFDPATVMFGSGTPLPATPVGAGPPYGTLRVTTVAAAQGGVDVTVTNVDDGQTATDVFTAQGVDGYFNLSEPSVTGLSPSSGPVGGGTTVTISGADLLSGAQVTFGGVAATNYDSTGAPDTLVCETQAGTAAGPVDVVVTNPDGGVDPAPHSQFTYQSNPSITTVTPASGVSGDTIIVTGTDFYAGIRVYVSDGTTDTVCANVTITGPYPATTVSADVPLCSAAGGADVYDVKVVNLDGPSATKSGAFTYLPNPDAVVPDKGNPSGGETVTISCADGSFTGLVTATIGSQACTNYDRSNVPDSFTCDTPAGTAGSTVDVIVTNGNPAPYPDPLSPHLSFAYGAMQYWELTSASDFGQQADGGVDARYAPGEVRLPLAPGTFFSCGDVATCAAYFRGGATPVATRFLVGTAAAGAFLTTDGGSTWTAFNLYTRPGFPSNRITCAAFHNHAGSSGNAFMIGTDCGVAVTYDGGSTFTVWDAGTTPALPHDHVWDVDFADGYASPDHMLIATADPTEANNAGGCLYTTDGGATVTIFDASNFDTDPGGNDNDTNRTMSADFYDPDTTGGPTFLIACQQEAGGSQEGAVYKTEDGGATAFVEKREPNWGNTQYPCVVRFNNASGDSDSYIVGSSETGGSAEGASFTVDDGASWTSITRPGDFAVVDAAWYDGTRFLIATEGGVSVTQDGGSTWQFIRTASTGSFANVSDDFTRGVAWHEAMGTADHFLIACGDKEGNAVTGALERTTNGGTGFTAYASDPGGTPLAQPPAVLPSADVTDVAFSNASADVYLVGTHDGAAFYDGTTFRWCNQSNNPALPSDDIQAVALYEVSGTPPTYSLLLGTDAGLAYSTDGGATFTNETANLAGSADIRGVAFHDGTHYACCSASTGAVNFHDGLNGWSSVDSLTAGIPSDDFRGIDLYRGTGTLDWVIFGTASNGVVCGSFQLGTYANYTQPGDLPGDTVRAVAFDQGSPISGGNPSDLGAVVATASGSARARNLQATPAWKSFTTAGTPALPSDDVLDCAYFGGIATGSSYMFATAAGIVYTTNDGSALTRVTDATTPDYLPRLATSACAYFDGNTTGDRMLWACPAPAAEQPGGVVLKTGTYYESAGSMTVLSVDGQLLPAASNVPSLPDRNVRGVCYLDGSAYVTGTATFTAGSAVVNGSGTGWTSSPIGPGWALRADSVGTNYEVLSVDSDTQITLTASVAAGDGATGAAYTASPAATTFAVATDYGVAMTTDGGRSFTALREPDTPLPNALPTNRIRCIAFFKGDEETLLVGTPRGAALTTDAGGSWTVFDTTTTPALPSDNVLWTAFHDGYASPSVYLICTDQGTLYVKGGASTTFVNDGGMDACHTCADFDDGDTDGTHGFILTTPGNESGSRGAWHTTDDGGTFQRYDGGELVNAHAVTVACHDASTFLIGLDRTLLGGSGDGGAERTTNGGTTFTNFDGTDGLLDDSVRYVAVNDRLGAPTHWMTGHPGAGVCVTTNGDQAPGTASFVQYTAPALPSNNVLCVAYAGGDLSGLAGDGNVWAVGTAGGLVQTTDGGNDLALLRKTCTAYERIDVSENKPAGTSITYDILDGSGAPLSGYQGMMPTAGSLDIRGIDHGAHPVIRVRVNFSTTDTSVTPALLAIKIYFVY